MLKTLLGLNNVSWGTVNNFEPNLRPMMIAASAETPTMEKTLQQYQSVIDKCRATFEKKMNDYGSSWRILRTSSLTDQLFIKAQRIRSIEEKGSQLIGDSVVSEFESLVNYAIIALMQLELKPAEEPHMPIDKAMALYTHYANEAGSLMSKKNHDYGEAWRTMRVSSLTDLILSKIMRIKQIEDNDGRTLISEGIDSNYYDILNYAVFALIKFDEEV
jgi:Nucleotide modification associated domain 1